ncbi:MAG: iron-containing alcohol dehydrogenase family protein [Planctomycetota bacterium]|jgi:alcohol dehydrogenase
MQVFKTSPVIINGYGAFEKSADYISGIGEKCLIVTGEKSMQEQGFIERLKQLLQSREITCEIYSGVKPEPEVNIVDEAKAAALDFKADMIIGIGGGSAVDVAKAAAGLIKEPADTAAYLHGEEEMHCNGIPFIAMPSTFGTGTEVTPNAVLSDHKTNIKKSIRHDGLLAELAVIDPELGQGAPQTVKAESGLDAFCQAVESFLSDKSGAVTQSLSFGAVALLASSLEDFVFDPENKEAAENCASGSLMAGMALANARLGAVHGLAHPLGIRSGISHGKICGILLPYIMMYNQSAAQQQYELLTGIVGIDITFFCKSLVKKLGLPLDLTETNFTEDDISAIAAEALPSGSMQANPRKATEDDLKIILREACMRKSESDKEE